MRPAMTLTDILICPLCGAPLTRRTGTSGKKDGKPVHFKYWICRTRLKKQECLCPIKKEEKLLSFCAYERIVISPDGISVS